MIRFTLFSLLFAFPVLVSAGIFSKGSGVTMLDEKGFKSLMKEEVTSVVAFVAPWCGHCKNLAPEYLKAAKSMDPLVKFYAVDCDEEKNKPLCGQQGIKGFPTVKSFPRGSKGVPHEYQGERKAKAIAEWVGQEVPNKVETVNTHSNVNKWTKKAESKPRFLLLNAQTKLPLLWRVLSHNFKDKAAFAATRSKDKIAAITSGLNVSLEVGDKSKVLYWAPGETEPKIYEGTLKYDPLSKFVKELLEGSSRAKEEL